MVTKAEVAEVQHCHFKERRSYFLPMSSDSARCRGSSSVKYADKSFVDYPPGTAKLHLSSLHKFPRSRSAISKITR